MKERHVAKEQTTITEQQTYTDPIIFINEFLVATIDQPSKRTNTWQSDILDSNI
jgi:hypothetical protein